MAESRRMLPVDAVRGLAMLFVSVSHISTAYLWQHSPSLGNWMIWASYFATPNFLLLSGLVSGYQIGNSRSHGTISRIVDRGLFVLLVGHFLVAASLVYSAAPGTSPLRSLVITDMIGLALCTTPFWQRFSARQLAFTGLALFLFSWPFAVLWKPNGAAAAMFKALLFNERTDSPQTAGLANATVAYFGLFIIGMGLGKMIAIPIKAARHQEAGRLLLRIGAISVFTACTLNIAGHFIKPILLRHIANPDLVNTLIDTLQVRFKKPPTPPYGLFYGGVGLLMVGLLMCTPKASLLRAPIRTIAVIGRASLISYVVQQWLVDFLPVWLGIEAWLTVAGSLIYLLLATAVQLLIAWAWDRARGNRLLTLGLRPVHGGSVSLPNPF